MPVAILAALAGLLVQAEAASSAELEAVASQVRELSSQVAELKAALRQRETALEQLRGDVAPMKEDVAGLKERVGQDVATTFLEGPPASTDAVGYAQVAVFSPRVMVDTARRHDVVSFRVKRVDAGAVRPIAEVVLARDDYAVELPLDRNGALYVVDWSTAEGFSYNLVLRDGAGGPDDLGGQPAASVQVKPYQSQGRLIFVGYRVE